MTTEDAQYIVEPANNYEFYASLRMKTDTIESLSNHYFCAGSTREERAERYKKLREVLQPCIEELSLLAYPEEYKLGRCPDSWRRCANGDCVAPGELCP